MLSLPFIFSVHSPFLGFAAAVFSVLKVLRCVELAQGCVHDPEMLKRFSRFLIWQTTGSDTRWPRSNEELVQNRATGLHAFAETALYSIATIVLVLVVHATPLEARSEILKWLFMALAMGTTLPAVAALTSIGPMTLGVKVKRAMNHPLAARSLNDFWSRRWNLAFRDLAHRCLYVPMRSRGVPTTKSIFSVFAASAVIHEYLILVSTRSYLGLMTIFFITHGGLVLLERQFFTRLSILKWRPLGCLWTWFWLLLTSPLFFLPFASIVDIYGTIERLAAVLFG